MSKTCTRHLMIHGLFVGAASSNPDPGGARRDGRVGIPATLTQSQNEL
jgi:hypothetical protein